MKYADACCYHDIATLLRQYTQRVIKQWTTVNVLCYDRCLL